MTLAADTLERPAPAAPSGPDPRIAVALRWIYMLHGLCEIGVRVATFLTHQIAPSERTRRQPMMVFRFRGDAFIAFERVFRAVRLAICLAMRIEDEIDDLRAGRPLAPDSLFQAPRAKAERMNALSEAVRKRPRPGDEARQTTLHDITEEVETPETAENFMGEFSEDLREDPEFYRLLNGPLKDAIAAICADLGLKPDWSLWTEDGFPSPPGGTEEDWVAFFAPEGDTGPAPPPERTSPQAAPPAPVRDPRHVLDPPRRDLNAFLAANGVKPLPPPPDQRHASRLPPWALSPPRGASGLPTTLFP
jgi:hypothetical protein